MEVRSGEERKTKSAVTSATNTASSFARHRRRVGLGSALTVVDVITDINVTLSFRHGGEAQAGYYHGMLISLGFSWGLQIFGTIMQNKGRKGNALVRELLWAVVFLKSPRDAYKVASGLKQEKGALVNPLTELTASKGCELFTEGLPAVFIQITSAIFKGRITQMELLSLIVSIMMCGFTSAQISYDFDTSPEKRDEKPDFYGYVPDGSHPRTICFGSLIFISSFMLAIKALSLVLVSTVSPKYAVIFFAIDIGIFLLLKIIRKDFIYWVPTKGITSIEVSLVTRIVVKVVTDFTSIVQARHPNEVGGVQWSLGQLATFLILFIALFVAEDYGSLGYDIANLWYISYCLAGAALLSFCVFFSVINEGYIHTFFSLETGGQMNIRVFRASEDEGVKASTIFYNNESQWKSIRDEVKKWTWQNWPRWMEEKPAWFDERMRSMIPLDMIPSLVEQTRILAEGRRVSAKVPPGVGKEDSSSPIGLGSTIKRKISGILEGKTKNTKVVPQGEGDGVSAATAKELLRMARRGSLTG